MGERENWTYSDNKPEIKRSLFSLENVKNVRSIPWELVQWYPNFLLGILYWNVHTRHSISPQTQPINNKTLGFFIAKKKHISELSIWKNSNSVKNWANMYMTLCVFSSWLIITVASKHRVVGWLLPRSSLDFICNVISRRLECCVYIYAYLCFSSFVLKFFYLFTTLLMGRSHDYLSVLIILDL